MARPIRNDPWNELSQTGPRRGERPTKDRDVCTTSALDHRTGSPPPRGRTSAVNLLISLRIQPRGARALGAPHAWARHSIRRRRSVRWVHAEIVF
jgi:hypothetical protein